MNENFLSATAGAACENCAKLSKRISNSLPSYGGFFGKDIGTGMIDHW